MRSKLVLALVTALVAIGVVGALTAQGGSRHSHPLVVKHLSIQTSAAPQDAAGELLRCPNGFKAVGVGTKYGDGLPSYAETGFFPPNTVSTIYYNESPSTTAQVTLQAVCLKTRTKPVRAKVSLVAAEAAVERQAAALEAEIER